MEEALYPRSLDRAHRLCSPEQTLAWISPLLERCGITRIAEITGLDEDLGVLTYTAVRPGGLTLQVSSGKGLSSAAAKVSAAMEAIELYHCEHPDTSHFTRGKANEMTARGLDVRLPSRTRADREFHYSPDRVIDWIQGEDLITGARPWVPASVAFFIEPTIYRASTNGLASGNHVIEATLHALYELLERDAISRLVVDGALDIEGSCRVVDTSTISHGPLRGILAKLRAAQRQLVLLWVPSPAPVHVFWAILLDPGSHRPATALVTGSGAHPDMGIAATRALTEAIQSRLTIIQAAREDVILRSSFTQGELDPGPASRFFADLASDTSWEGIEALTYDPTRLELRARLAGLLAALARSGHDTALRVNLSLPEFDVPVVKVLVPSLLFHRALF